MTDKKFAAMKEPARAEADRVVTLGSIEDAGRYLKNLALVTAQAMLRQWGWYGCVLHHADGTDEKLFLEIAA